MVTASPNLGEQLVEEVPEWEILGSHEQKGDHGDMVSRFRKDFREAFSNGTSIINIDDLTHNIKSPEKSIEMQLAKSVDSRADGRLYLSPEYRWLEGAGYTHFHARRTSGPKTSSHGVFFGVIHEKPDDVTNAIAVAIKPCVDKPLTAIEDWVGNSLARKVDDRSYEPIGFFTSNEIAYSITRFDPEGFDTLEKIPWVNAARYEGEPEYTEQQEILKKIGTSLANLHDNNVFHGDPQFKNIVHDISGETYFIDWESAKFYQETPPENIVVSKTEHDLRVLFGSMARSIHDNGVGLLEKKTPSAQWAAFRTFIFEPYEEAYIHELTNDFEKEQERRLDVLGEVEERMKDYVLNQGLRRSLASNRNQE
jgi:hypothetical protein